MRFRKQDSVSNVVALVITFVVVVVVALGITCIVQGNQFFPLKVSDVKTSQQGQVQQAQQAWTEWLATSNKFEKAAIVDVMNHNNADWSQSIWNACSPELRAWLESIQPGGPNSTIPYDEDF